MRLSAPGRRRSRPSLIPLIDVMLVLLFFFMLANTYVDYGRTRLELAPGGRASGLGNEADVVRVVVTDDGQLRVGVALLSPAQAVERLRRAKDVRLSPAPGVALQTLLAGWEQLKAAGVNVQLSEAAR